MQQLSPKELREWINAGTEFILVDVREPYENEHFNLGGLPIPLGELMNSLTAIPRDVPTVIYCEKGIRSMIAIQRLESRGFTRLFNLEGGIKAWRNSASSHAREQ